MKKLYFLCCIAIMFLFCGCENSPMAGVKECSHENYELEGVRYEYGSHCDDPKSIYVICRDCGEEVKAGQVASDRKCSKKSDEKPEVIKEATCTEEGLSKWTCRECGKVHNVVIHKDEHLYLHYWREDQLRCIGCSGNIPQETTDHEHEYEQVGYVDYSTKWDPKTGIYLGHVGRRGYQCKNCKDSYTTYFDGYGDFDLNTVLETVRDKAKQMGYQVILDSNLFLSGCDYPYEERHILYRETNSQELTQRLIEEGENALNSLAQKHSYLSPSEFMMYVSVECNGDFYIVFKLMSVEDFMEHWIDSLE